MSERTVFYGYEKDGYLLVGMVLWGGGAEI